MADPGSHPLRPRRRPPAVILPGRDGGTIKNSILTTEEVQRGKASNLQEVLHALDGHGGGLPPAGAEILPVVTTTGLDYDTRRWGVTGKNGPPGSPETTVTLRP